MSDVVATYGLDYGDYRKGLAAIEKTSAKHFAKQEKASLRAAQTIGTAAKAFIGGNVIQTSMRLASAAIGEFAERSPEAARSLESIKKAGSDAAAAIGQDLFHALGLGEGKIEGFIGKAEELRSSLVDGLAGPLRKLFGGDSSVEELNNLRAADLDSQLFSKFQREDKVRSIENQAGIAEASGRGEEASVLRERARNARALMEIGSIRYAPERDARKKQEEDLHAANMARITREKSQRAAASDAQEAAAAKRMAMEQELYNLEAKALNIQTLRAQGLEEEADQQEVILEYARNAARLRGDAGLSEDLRRDRLQANELRKQQALENLDLERQRRERERAANERAAPGETIDDAGIRGSVGGTASIESGLGGRSGLRAQVFGAGGGGLDPLTKEQKRANALLERIERNTAQRGSAVFA